MNPDLTLYDLAGADASLRFSPHCWKIHMALAHRGCRPPRCRGVSRTRKRSRSPARSWCRCCTTARRSAIPGGSPATWKTPFPTTLAVRRRGRPQAEPVRQQLERRHAGAHPGPAAAAVHPRADPREGPRLPPRHARKRFGPLEELPAGYAAQIEALRAALQPLRLTLARQPYLAGDAPAYADYAVFGMFMWARCTSAQELLAPDDAVHAWRERLLDAHGGLARAAQTASTQA